MFDIQIAERVAEVKHMEAVGVRQILWAFYGSLEYALSTKDSGISVFGIEMDDRKSNEGHHIVHLDDRHRHHSKGFRSRTNNERLACGSKGQSAYQAISIHQ